MTDGEIRMHQERIGFWQSRTKSPVVREPEQNVYGRFRVMNRSDGLCVVHDTKQWPPNGAVFRTEGEARDHAVGLVKLLSQLVR